MPVKRQPDERLSRERIVEAAIAVIERDGVAGLSMRRVASELDTGAMSLYRHVPNKAALLDEVVEAVAARLETELAEGGSWQDQLRARLWAVRRLAHDYPRVAALIYADYLNAPRVVALTRDLLGVLLAAGFGPEQAVAVLRVLMSFTLGEMTRERNVPAIRAAVEADPSALRAARKETATSAAVAEALVRYDYEADYAFGLDLLLAAADRLRASGASP